jgi:hypothetical protein
MAGYKRLDDCLSIREGRLYVEEMSSFHAIPRPATVLVIGDQAVLVRRRETEEDVLRRDVMPRHLRSGMVSGEEQP